MILECRGTQHFTGTVSNEATNGMGYPVWPTGRTCFRDSNRLSSEPARLLVLVHVFGCFYTVVAIWTGFLWGLLDRGSLG